MIDARQLAGRGAAQLAHRFDHVVHALDVAFGQRAAVGVQRQRAVGPLQGAVGGEAAAVAARTEAVGFEGEEDEGRERVVELRAVDVARVEAGLPVERRGGGVAARFEREAACASRACGRPAGRWPASRRGSAPAASAPSRARSARVTTSAAAASDSRQQSSRRSGVADRARGLMIGDGDRRAHQRQRVARRVGAAGDGDGAELRAGAAVLEHVAAHQQRHLVGGPQQAVRRAELRVAADRATELRPRPPARGALAHAPAHDRLGEAGGDRRRRRVRPCRRWRRRRTAPGRRSAGRDAERARRRRAPRSPPWRSSPARRRRRGVRPGVVERGDG